MMTRTEYDKYREEATIAASKALGMTCFEIKQNIETREERSRLRRAWGDAYEQYWNANFPAIPEDWNYWEAEE